MRMVRTVVTGWLLSLLPLFVQAQVKVRASVDNRTVALNQYVRFRLEIENAPFFGETPRPPEVQGLELARPFPSSSRNVSIINGRMRQSLAFEWLFRAVKPGTARIESMEIHISDQVYRTAPIEIEVFGTQPPASTRPAPASGKESLTEAVFIRPILSRKRAVPNQQVVLTYRLYFREGYRLRGSRMADSWDARGFWKEELKVNARPQPDVEIIDGLRYYSFPIKKYALFPVRTGTLRIEPFRMETEIYRPLTRDPLETFFLNFGDRFESVVLSAPPVTLQVDSLPPGAPEGFQDAVGSYRLKVAMQPTRVQMGEPVTLTVTVAGTGNLATLEPPELHLPEEIEPYAPSVEATINRDGPLINGVKTFTYVLIPKKAGNFTLPEVRFAYYDPARKAYRVRRATPGTLIVEGAVAPPPASPAETPVVKEAKTLPIWWWAGGGLALGLLVLVGWRLVARRKSIEESRSADPRKAHPEARKALKQAERLRKEGDLRACFEAVSRALQRFVALRLDLPERGWTREQLRLRMQQVKVPEALQQELFDLLDACDQALFAPLAPSAEEADHITHQAAACIAELDRYLPVSVSEK